MGSGIMLSIGCGLAIIMLGLVALWLYNLRRVHTLGLEQRLLQQALQQATLQQAAGSDALQALQQQKQSLEQRFGHLQAELATTTERLRQQEHWRTTCSELQQALKTQQAHHVAQQVELREAAVRLEESQRAAEQKQQLLLDSEQRLKLQFEHLAQRIFEQRGRTIDEQSRHSLEKLLLPLREQLEGFRRQVQDNFGQEARERHTLVHEIQQLQQLNMQIAKDAVNLTQALKGNNKTQGNWGEMVLGRVLEAAGLREGHEYQTQTSLTVDQTRRQQPDVIVHLPQGKAVVIDAKMSLTAYERYFNSAANGDEAGERAQALKEHLSSMRNHIRQLADKEYHKLLGSGSLEYTLMFIPVEPAFLLALDQDPALLNEALTRNIMLVSPTTLLVALRTIADLWRYERQNQNAEQIADNAARLYDKLRLFVDDMTQLGKALGKAQESYQQALSKLAQGRGNLIRQAEHFRALGVAVKRPLKSPLAEPIAPDLSDETLLVPGSSLSTAEAEQPAQQKVSR